MEETQPTQTLLAVYDGDCRACAGFAKVVRLLDVRGRLGVIPAQSAAAQRLFTLEELQQTFHVVLPGGRALVRGEALVQVLGGLTGLGWLPSIVGGSRRGSRVINRLYGWLARNRDWISYFA